MTKYTYAEAVARRDQLHGDPEFRKRYLEGGSEEAAQLREVCEVIATLAPPRGSRTPAAEPPRKSGFEMQLSPSEAAAMGAELIKFGAEPAKIDAALAADGVVQP